jgi:hypothetical protein
MKMLVHAERVQTFIFSEISYDVFLILDVLEHS